MVNFRRFATEAKAADALFNELTRVLSNGRAKAPDVSRIPPQRATAPYVVMLAGGTTPTGVYRRIAGEPPAAVNPMLHLMLSDDRLVPREDPRSNRGAIAPLAEALNLGAERIIAPQADGPADRAAEEWSQTIAELASRDAVLSLAVLGIGADGHTASLFSPSLIHAPATRPVATGALAPDLPGARHALATGVYGGTQRLSVAPEVILAFERLLFFATGPSKRDILYELSRRPDDYPAGRIMLQHPNAEIWTDAAPVVR